MAVKVAMPKLGLVMVEGVVVKWLVEDGKTAKKGEPICVIMSKKITYEVVAPADGVLRHVAKIKETIAVTRAIAYITSPGEALPAEDETSGTFSAVGAVPQIAATQEVASAAPAEGFVMASPSARRRAKELGVEISLVKGTGPDGKISETDVQKYAEAKAAQPEVLASSMAKKLAEEHGLDLTLIAGTGSGGRITEGDVQAYLEAQKKPALAAAAGIPAKPPRIIPFTGLRQMITERMVESLHGMAQVTESTEVDVTELVKMREQLKTKFDLTYTDIIIKAVTVALKEHPLLNSTQVGDEIHLLEQIHMGIAVALEDGLMVPVVRNADQMTLREIARETKRLAEGARAGTLDMEEVTGSTFTITNLGIWGIDTSTPIVNPPEVAILGVGRIIVKPAVFQDEIVKRSLMGLSLSFDHRIVDGAPASAFMKTLAGLLEKPYLLFA